MSDRPELTSKACAAFATVIHELRPDWNPDGISAALWANRGNDPFATLTAMVKAASDRKNLTPSSVNFTSSQEPFHQQCPDHPNAGTRTNGQCGSCWADRVAGGDEPAPVNVGNGLPPERVAGHAAKCRAMLDRREDVTA